jgi:RHS repeat-associated protein
VEWVREGEGENKFLFQGKELITQTGWQDFGARMYDGATGRWFVVDPAGQFSSPYNGMGNNPVIGIDPDGRFWHIIIGAAIGGVANLVVKAFQGKINSWGDGFVAFGIGAVAGAVGAATGGAAFTAAGGAAAGAGGFLAGFAGGAVGAAYSMPLQSIGNSAYFGDPMMTPGEYATGILFGGFLGGSINGAIALANGKPFLDGTIRSVGNTNSPLALKVPNLGNKPKIELDYQQRLQSMRGGADDVVNELPTTKPSDTSLGGGDRLTPKLLTAPKLHDHHIFPQQYKQWFSSKGINVDDYTIPISGKTHLQGVHGNGIGNLPGRWNQSWAEFIRANPNASPSQVFKFGEDLLYRFGFEHLKYAPYR